MTTKNSADLLETIVQQEKASLEFGFYWENAEQILQQAESECHEIREALLKQDLSHIKEEVGDLINAAISLCIFLGFDPKSTLSDNIEKYQKRFDTLVSLVKAEGLDDLTHKPMDVLLRYWGEAKKLTTKETI